MGKKYNEIEVKNNMNVETDENKEVVAPKERPKMEKLVDIQPKKVKRGLFGRLVAGIVGPEGIPSIGAYVNDEIIKPAIKNIIVDAVTSGINMVMYGDRGTPSRGRHSSHSGRREPYRPSTNYNTRYSNSQPEPRDRVISRTPRHGVTEYVIEDRYDAAHVLTSLTEYADKYDTVSIAEYYDLIGVDTKFTDNSYGWTIDTIVDARIVPVRGGYVIKFPPVEVL
jgi:hypothetical protein